MLKKRMRKRLIAGIAVVILVSGTLSGCRSGLTNNLKAAINEHLKKEKLEEAVDDLLYHNANENDYDAQEGILPEATVSEVNQIINGDYDISKVCGSFIGGRAWGEYNNDGEACLALINEEGSIIYSRAAKYDGFGVMEHEGF